MELRSIPVDSINPAPYNPRLDLQPGDPEYERLRRSLDEFGYVEPIVWNSRTGNIVGGHQRFKILCDQGQREIEVVVMDLDDTKEKALNIALNKISGDWDEEMLSALLQELISENVDITLTGFESEEAAKLIQDFTSGSDDGIGDFENRELNQEWFDEGQFDCICPKCGFAFNPKQAGGSNA